MAFRTGNRSVFTGAGGPGIIEKERLTLPQMLRDKGYSTALFGKWHVGLTFLDSSGKPINDNKPEAIQRIDFTRPIPDAPSRSNARLHATPTASDSPPRFFASAPKRHSSEKARLVPNGASQGAPRRPRPAVWISQTTAVPEAAPAGDDPEADGDVVSEADGVAAGPDGEADDVPLEDPA
jgi:arylsulfatase A-like enzyme